MTTTCIVTGAAGFIGSHLSASLLADGWQVVGIDNFDPFYKQSAKECNLDQIAHRNFTFIEADICDASAIARHTKAARPSIIFHIAALAGVRPSIENPARYAQVNLDGLVNVVDAARCADCRNIVFASSSSVYGNNEKVPFAETDSVDEPISPYAATKRSGELLCHTYAHLFGMSIGCLRFFTVFGPAQRPDLAISKFMHRIASGEAVPMFGDGTTSRDYTYIDDIISGVRAAADNVSRAEDHSCRIWNLGGSRPISLAEMIDVIAETVGRPAKVEPHPMQPGDVNRTWADLTRSKSELGYHPQTPFREGVARQWQWLQSMDPAAC